MKRRTTLASLAVFFAGIGLALASDMNMGTWKLNEGKSKFAPGATKNTTVTYAPAGDMVKVTTDGVNKDGKPVHTEWTGKYDGKDYPVSGDPVGYDTRAYTPVGQHSLSMTVKKGGKVVATGKITVAADGKSRTVTTTGDDPSMNNSAVYDKQ